MGCDIHVYIEQRDKETNKWEYLNLYKKNEDGTFSANDVYSDRCYDLFGLLAGVRSCVEPFVPSRGLPDDLSEEVKDAWDSCEDCWHTPTWYDYCELCAYLKFVKQKDLYVKTKAELDALKDPDECDYYGEDYSSSDVLGGFMDTISYVFESYGIYYPNPNEIRVVMWFDN